ncbi:hypothetical protein VA7868_03646 [Vibrio aerogenes CECT 7868]|uniref:Gene 25-like lysozyme n=1 Tax=Vibrio aerogenes CECT 7868 TaxID=1216006 RepID=A0A1M6AR92_9VIBR|nr:hypothetical protein [Vibrio aerogenes]SHI39000.1 hypothetical protein VA7868_03646 [Vibrio aerogenes CECT 7868]
MEDSQFLEGGWKFPPVRSGVAHPFPEEDCDEQDINQSVDTVLHSYLTERCIPFLNCESYYAFDDIRVRNAVLKDEIAFFVRCALLNSEPRIHVNEVQVIYFSEAGAMADIMICYTIRQTNSQHHHRFSFSFSELA